MDCYGLYSPTLAHVLNTCHICALDEFRANFALSDIGKAADDNIELFLPGCHSDIGGGYSTNYYNQYGGSVGSSTTRSSYGGSYSTNYYDRYGGSTGSATTRSNYGGGYTTNYYDQYGGSIGSSTTRSNYGGGYTTTYYDAYGSSIGSSYDW